MTQSRARSQAEAMRERLEHQALSRTSSNRDVDQLDSPLSSSHSSQANTTGSRGEAQAVAAIPSTTVLTLPIGAQRGRQTAVVMRQVVYGEVPPAAVYDPPFGSPVLSGGGGSDDAHQHDAQQQHHRVHPPSHSVAHVREQDSDGEGSLTNADSHTLLSSHTHSEWDSQTLLSSSPPTTSISLQEHRVPSWSHQASPPSAPSAPSLASHETAGDETAGDEAAGDEGLRDGDDGLPHDGLRDDGLPDDALPASRPPSIEEHTSPPPSPPAHAAGPLQVAGDGAPQRRQDVERVDDVARLEDAHHPHQHHMNIGGVIAASDALSMHHTTASLLSSNSIIDMHSNNTIDMHSNNTIDMHHSQNDIEYESNHSSHHKTAPHAFESLPFLEDKDAGGMQEEGSVGVSSRPESGKIEFRPESPKSCAPTPGGRGGDGGDGEDGEDGSSESQSALESHPVSPSARAPVEPLATAHAAREGGGGALVAA
mmetsp:Transcript_14420/g.22934  ORF Transcript_14420/g.22934 Transcript_14420/m.22934 type:complete len:481 (-) Transcript_14420:1121-2563(-)